MSSSSSQSSVVVGRLSKKDNELFRSLVTMYEKKQYAKGLKTADTILKKSPNHGETQAMKGLILNCLYRKEEAYELVKLGLRNDVRSHICWHVYGLLYRSDNKYADAIKCYLNALRIDPDNQNILRDISWLQIQMRDFVGFMSTRKRLLDLKPTQRQSWIAFIVSNYAAGEFNIAVEVISKYYEHTKEKDRADAYEEGELLLFQNKCLEKQGKWNEAVDHLKKNRNSIVDKLSWSVKLAELLSLSGRFDEAVIQWIKLVNLQPDNYRFHCGMQTAHLQLDSSSCAIMFSSKRLELPSTNLRLSSSQRKSLRELYQKYNFKSKSINKIILTLFQYGEGDAEEDAQFENVLTAHVTRHLRDGMPSLHNDICALLRSHDKDSGNKYILDAYDVKRHPVFKLVLRLVDKFTDNLKKYSLFVEPTEGAESTSAVLEPPTALLWALYLKSTLLEICGDLDGAVSVIDECILHTPTAIDMYCKRSKLLKKQGNLALAAVTMDDCRLLDLQDRYLNNKTTKYFLRNDEMGQAMATIAMFTKHEGDPQKILFELQCIWYELEAGESFLRKKQWGQALKKFYAIKKHFNDFYEDMFDFHGYCVRKSTLRAYVDVLNTQDDAYTHKNFQRAARGVLSTFLHLLDCPEDIDGLGHLPPAERKKRREKIKKQKKKDEAREKAEKEDALWTGSNNPSGNNGADSAAKKEKDSIWAEDPTGEKLLQTAQKDFLSEATTWCSLLISRAALCDSETLALLAEVYLRRGKYVQVMRALTVGLHKDPLHPELNLRLVKFVAQVLTAPSSGKKAKVSSVPASITAILKESVAKILSHPSLDFNAGDIAAQFLQKALSLRSMPHLLAALKSAAVVDAAGKAFQTAAELISDTNLISDGRGVSAENVINLLKYLQGNFSSEPAVEAFARNAAALFPHAVSRDAKAGDAQEAETEDAAHHQAVSVKG